MSEQKQYQKITRGTIYLFIDGDGKKRRRIKPNQIITATEESLGNFIDDFVEVSNPTPEQQKAPNMVAKKAEQPKRTRKRKETAEEEEVVEPTESEANEGYRLDPTGAGWYNVLNPNGKVVNESKLREDAALALVDSLTTSESEE